MSVRLEDKNVIFFGEDTSKLTTLTSDTQGRITLRNQDDDMIPNIIDNVHNIEIMNGDNSEFKTILATKSLSDNSYFCFPHNSGESGNMLVTDGTGNTSFEDSLKVVKGAGEPNDIQFTNPENHLLHCGQLSKFKYYDHYSEPKLMIGKEGGNVQFKTYDAESDATTGCSLTIEAGNGKTAGRGGDIDIKSGQGGSENAGGDINIMAGMGGIDEGRGGDINITAGLSREIGEGGKMIFQSGNYTEDAEAFLFQNSIGQPIMTLMSNFNESDSTSTGTMRVNGGAGFTHNVVSPLFHIYSDQRLKENIKPIENPIKIVKKIRGYNYYLKNKKVDSNKQSGVIAQELEKAGLDYLVREDSQKMKSVNYDGLIPILLESQREMIKRQEKMMKKINYLSQEMAKLRVENKRLKAYKYDINLS